VLLQTCVPPEPQSCVEPITHAPPSMQSPQSDHVPSALQMRVRVPQLPHVSVGNPSHALPTGDFGPLAITELIITAGDSAGSVTDDQVPHVGVALVFAPQELL
jgi:hypothetical protein